MNNILKAPPLIVRFILGLINISRETVNLVLCKYIDKLIQIGLYEPRLTILVQTLEDHLFGVKQTEPSPSELLERQRQAKLRLERITKNFGTVADTLQSPALNKHLMYCLFDIIVAEIYPELENGQKLR